mmetsp:Transcript_71432/g.213096  ORF Transcript_71432/g.213096 Transcript_71432/m.213096 type:complete len:225 (+) Transcript_71432:98-772(+)
MYISRIFATKSMKPGKSAPTLLSRIDLIFRCSVWDLGATPRVRKSSMTSSELSSPLPSWSTWSKICSRKRISWRRSWKVSSSISCSAWILRWRALMTRWCSSTTAMIFAKKVSNSSCLTKSRVCCRTSSMRARRLLLWSCSSRRSRGRICFTASMTSSCFRRALKSLLRPSMLLCSIPCRRWFRAFRTEGTRSTANSAKAQPTFPLALDSQSRATVRRSQVAMH